MGIIKPLITEADVQAIRAMKNGVANAGQQMLAIDWIMGEAARVTDLAFMMGDDGRRDTDFALGRQYVGHLIREMLLPATLEAARSRDKRRTHT